LSRVADASGLVEHRDRGSGTVTVACDFGTRLLEPSGSIERWSGAGLNEAEVLTATLATPLLEGFELEVRDLFRRS
jgi:hypothetical protein